MSAMVAQASPCDTAVLIRVGYVYHVPGAPFGTDGNRLGCWSRSRFLFAISICRFFSSRIA